MRGLLKWIKKNTKDILRDWKIYVLLLPLLIWLIVFSYVPMYGLQIAFKKYSLFKGIENSPWDGWDNFKTLLTGEQSTLFWRAFKNTLIISFYGIIFGFPIPIILALLFNEVKNNLFRKTVQTITYLPHFISEVIIVSVVVQALSPKTGFVNFLLSKIANLFNLSLNLPIYFMAKAQYFRPIYTITGIWKEAGFNSIVYFAALAAIPPVLYEASRIDGASIFQQMRYISIPGIMSTITIMFIIRVGKILDVGFERVLLLVTPTTQSTGEVLSTYVYNLGFATNNPNFGLATAAGLFNAVIGFGLVKIANSVSKKFNNSTLW